MTKRDKITKKAKLWVLHFKRNLLKKALKRCFFIFLFAIINIHKKGHNATLRSNVWEL